MADKGKPNGPSSQPLETQRNAVYQNITLQEHTQTNHDKNDTTINSDNTSSKPKKMSDMNRNKQSIMDQHPSIDINNLDDSDDGREELEDVFEATPTTPPAPAHALRRLASRPHHRWAEHRRGAPSEPPPTDGRRGRGFSSTSEVSEEDEEAEEYVEDRENDEGEAGFFQKLRQQQFMEQLARRSKGGGVNPNPGGRPNPNPHKMIKKTKSATFSLDGMLYTIGECVVFVKSLFF